MVFCVMTSFWYTRTVSVSVPFPREALLKEVLCLLNAEGL